MLPTTAKNFIVFLFAIIVLITTSLVQAKQPVPVQDLPILLEIVSPVPPEVNYKKEKTEESRNIQFRSGWPLTFKLSTNDEHLLGTFIPASPNGAVSPYPEAGTPAWLIFDDADDCLYLEGWAFNGYTKCGDELPGGGEVGVPGLPPGGGVVGLPPGAGEVFLNFTPDIDFPYLADLDPQLDSDPQGVYPYGSGHLRSHGRPDLRAELAKRYPDNGPEWGGPALSVQGTLDGVGYGPNDDLPGLVVISNTGVGIVYNPLEFEESCVTTKNYKPCWDQEPPLGILESWERTVPEARHNLSGLMGMVGYELNDQKLQTTITTSLLVPRHLFTHLELRDPEYDDNRCNERLGFANVIDAETNDAGPVINCPGIDISTSIVELRAFVINGTAPTIVEECDGEEGVTAADVECNVDPSTGGNYTLISNEVVLEFVQIGGLIAECNVFVDPWGVGHNVKMVDLDGNLAHYGAVCPGGGGGIGRIPR